MPISLLQRTQRKGSYLTRDAEDAKVTALPLEVGDRVLVRNLSLRKKHKLLADLKPLSDRPMRMYQFTS